MLEVRAREWLRVVSSTSGRDTVTHCCHCRNEDTCTGAAQNGHLEVLKYLHENDCEWSDQTASLAAEAGQLECLKYLHENECEWYVLSSLLVLYKC